MNVDLKAMFDSLSENIRSLGGFNPEQVKRAGFVDEEGLRILVLRSLNGAPKTGHELSTAVDELSRGKVSASPSRIYPLLERLLDEGLISVATKKDRKIYSLTESGKTAEASFAEIPIEEPEANESTWALPKWVDVRGVIPIAATRLGKVSLEVAQFGTKDQQERAAAAIDDARKRIHEILSEQ
jgi:DNA-binding PadR family transcriptional regulator